MRANARIMPDMSASAPSAPPVARRSDVAAAATRPVTTLRGLPLLGNLLEFRGDRIGFQRRLAGIDGLVRFHIGPVPVHMLTDAEMAGQLLIDNPDAVKKSRGLAVFAKP